LKKRLYGEASHGYLIGINGILFGIRPILFGINFDLFGIQSYLIGIKAHLIGFAHFLPYKTKVYIKKAVAIKPPLPDYIPIIMTELDNSFLLQQVSGNTLILRN